MKAGALRHRVFIEDHISELDSDGAMVESWEPVFDGPVSAEIAPLSGRELIASQAVQSKVSVRIKIRYRAEVTARMRVVHRSAIYNIEAVIPDMQSGIRYLTLLCSTGVNEG